ncbi:MAG: hypothetical protein PHU31_06370 [Anaerotignum sp.]|nr:hypothetical protein [Anaerotignum sp.]
MYVWMDGIANSSRIVNCFNKGAIVVSEPGTYAFHGSLIGYLQNGMMSECYWLTDTHDNAAGRNNPTSINIRSFSSTGEFDSSLPEIGGTTCTNLTEALNTLVDSGTNSQSYCHWNDAGADPSFFTNWSEVAAHAKPATDYTVSENDYTVQTALGLAYVASLVNNGDSVNSITLSQDIDLSGYQ